MEPLIHEIRRGRLAAVWVRDRGEFLPLDAFRPTGLLSGSFHPLHPGHERLRQVAAASIGGEVFFELSLRNVEKPELAADDLRLRLGQEFTCPVLLTSAAVFRDKAQVCPGTTFVVGADTAERVVDARFHQDSPDRLREAIDVIRDHGCRFLVAARNDADRLLRLSDVRVPEYAHDLFMEIPVDQFREDISSTQIRAAGAFGNAVGPSALFVAAPLVAVPSLLPQLPLFVFGTLRRGQCNHHHLDGKYDCVTQARLYGFRRSQPLMIVPAADEVVEGEVFRINANDYERVMLGCDRLEGIPSGSTVGKWYERRIVAVRADGESLLAWAYVEPDTDD